ncbi:MAG: hypothetical protein GF401_19685 [Chitinivibrionales bacterium]|nr:hypothetical protein [Chitinivibrionales bacterium]
MNEKNVRKPISNFFIKKSIQLSVIYKILLVVFLTAFLTTLSLAYVYNTKSQKGTFYYMSNDIRQDIELQSVLGIILPSVVTAQVISIALGLIIGLFSSRKVAVPIYKFENWVTQLKKGKLTTHLGFREQNQMRDLTVQCNAMVDYYRQTVADLKEIVRTVEQNKEDPVTVGKQAERALQILEKFTI